MSHPHRQDAMTASAGKLTSLLGHSKHKAHGSPYGKGSFTKAPKADGMHDAPLPFRGTAGYAGNAKKPSPRHPKTGGKVPGFAAGGRADKFARGGPGKGDKKHGTTVNITVQGGGKQQPPMMPPPAPPPMPPGGGGPNPMAGPTGGMPGGMPNMPGVPNMMGAAGQNPGAMMKGLGTPLGGMPGGRKQGGRIGYKKGGRAYQEGGDVPDYVAKQQEWSKTLPPSRDELDVRAEQLAKQREFSKMLGPSKAKGGAVGYKSGGRANLGKSGIMGENKGHWEGYAKTGSKNRAQPAPSGHMGKPKLYARGGHVNPQAPYGAATGLGREAQNDYYKAKGKHGIKAHDPYGGR